MGARWSFLEDTPLDDPRNFLVVAAAFLVQFSIWGVRASLSAFTHAIDRDPQFCDCYDELRHVTNGTANTNAPTIDDVYKCCDNRHLVATAVGIACGLGPVCGIFAGYLSGRFGARALVVLSAVCVAASLLLSTVANSRTTFLLAYAPLMAIGSGFMVTPGAFATGTRFDKLLPLAMGIVYGGGGAGSAAIPRVAGALLDHLGADRWREVQRYLSISTALCFCVGIFVHERRKTLAAAAPPAVKDSKTPLLSGGEEGDGDAVVREPELKSLLLSRRYIVSLTAAALYGYSYYAALFSLVPYSRAHGDPTSEAYRNYPHISLGGASSMMLAFGLAQCTGSVLLGFVSTKLNFYRMNLICTLASGVVLACLPECHSLVQIGACAALLGLFSAGCRLCFPSMVTGMFRGPCLGAMIGLTLMGYGLGALPGPPLSSYITAQRGGNYAVAMYIMGASVVTSGLLSFFVMQRLAAEAAAPVDEIDAAADDSKRRSIN